MRKLVVVAAVAAAWLLVLGAPPAEAEKVWVTVSYDHPEGGHRVDVWSYDTEKAESAEKESVHYFDENHERVGAWYKDYGWDTGNPTPEDPGYGDKPFGHREGPAPGPLGQIPSPKVEPSYTKWSEKGFRLEKGKGFGIQGKGKHGDLINPAPDDAGGGKDDDDEPKGKPDPKLGGEVKGIDKEVAEQLGKEQMPGVETSLVGMDYVRLHNPAPDDPGDDGGPMPKGQGGGGPKPGGGDDTKSSGGGGGGPGGGTGGDLGEAGGDDAGIQSLGEAALQALVNPEPFGPGGGPFGMQDMMDAMGRQPPLPGGMLGGMPAGAPSGPPPASSPTMGPGGPFPFP